MILIGDVEAADERHGIVTNEHLPMIAVTPSAKMHRIKPKTLPARGAQRFPKRVRQTKRPNRVHQHLHLDPAFRRCNQSVAKPLANRPKMKNISLEPNGFPHRRQTFQHRLQSFQAGPQPAEPRPLLKHRGFLDLLDCRHAGHPKPTIRLPPRK
jgi:hypothetical protein